MIERVFHVNVNCSNLDRSIAFYRDIVGLAAGAHTAPVEDQPGAGFGLDRVQWDAYMMSDARGTDGVVIGLLQWKVPPPTGAPPVVLNPLGFARLCFLAADLDERYARVRAAGIPCIAAPVTADLGVPGMAPVRLFVCRDPDGTAMQFVQGDVDRLVHVNVNCSDLARSRDFYLSVLGFHERARSTPDTQDGSVLGLGPDVRWDASFLDDQRGNGSFIVDLVEWKQPRPTGRPARSANQLGIYRMAMFSDDIDADHERIRAAGVECPPPVSLDMGPGLPRVRASFFPDPDGTTLELIQTQRA